MFRTDYDVLIVGGGIVGLATALRLLQSRPELRLALLEKESTLASHQSGHNSGVIHSGLYYKSGSEKALQCRKGYDALIAFCREEGINHEICGKIVVASTTEQFLQLEQLRIRGIANGLTGLRHLSGSELAELEPECQGVGALFVPQTGIVDYRVVAMRMGEKIRELGGEIHLGKRVDTIKHCTSHVEVLTPSVAHTAKLLVTCAGLHSDRLALQSTPDLPMRIVPFRGEYFTLGDEAHRLVRNLIYPVPDARFPFLGVHFTRRIGGEVECGPNAVFALSREGYRKFDINIRDTVESLRWPGFRSLVKNNWRFGLGEFRRSLSKRAFATALQRLVPAIREGDLVAGGSGVRAQACWRNGSLVDDFHVVELADVIHVCNAPSPAATASLAIGDALANRIQRHLA
jgi:(S)-2-hydroxyglutarate dehydrogenase